MRLPQDASLFTGRMDHSLDDKTSLMGRYAFQSNDLFFGTNSLSPYQDFNTGQINRYQNVNLTATRDLSAALRRVGRRLQPIPQSATDRRRAGDHAVLAIYPLQQASDRLNRLSGLCAGRLRLVCSSIHLNDHPLTATFVVSKQRSTRLFSRYLRVLEKLSVNMMAA